MLPDLIAAVEQQLASPRTPYVSRTLVRLREMGVEEDEAVTQIALCLGKTMDDMVRKRKPFDEAAYQAALDALPMPEEPDGGDLGP
jgi:hypothetical protein